MKNKKKFTWKLYSSGANIDVSHYVGYLLKARQEQFDKEMDKLIWMALGRGKSTVGKTRKRKGK